MKDKKGIAISNAFQKILDESNCKPNKIWLDKGSEVYNRSIKSWLEKTAIEMYSIFDVKSNIYINSSKETNDEDPKSKIGDIVRISKHKNVFAKVMF